MAKKELTMTDSMGVEVPVRYIPKHDRDCDRIVQRTLKRWIRARANLEKVMADTLSDLEQVLDIRDDAGIAASQKGNLQVSSFDGLTTVQLKVQYNIRLDERVSQARDMMLEYARGLAKQIEGDDGQALLAIIDETFQANRSGSLSTTKVLSLLRLDIKAKAWREAAKLLSDSIKTTRGKSYLRVEQRPTRQHDPVPIRLDIADCWPTEEV
jgi:hypothetical protein